MIANFLARILHHTARCDEGRDAVVSLASLSGVEEDMAIRSSHSTTTNVYEQLGKLVIDVETLSGPSALID